MSEAPASPGGGSHESGEHSPRSNIREQDRFLPIANISRIMKKALPANGKIAKDAKETVQECVSEFISFITSEASDKCQREKRKTINGDDLLWAMATLGFEDYIDPLKIYLTRYRESYFEVLLLLCFLLMVIFSLLCRGLVRLEMFQMEGDTKGSGKGGDSSAKKDLQQGSNSQLVHQGSFSQGVSYTNSQGQHMMVPMQGPE
ncbi:Nuclear transcription factor Y subunit B-8 [Lathyrus oleraceus]|uniref:Nuclear transcription factor Y subunit B-8 n=2 Tax=IRL clade TaxID=2233839 RepID=A0A9D5B176_PEA|nr:Nuclear transcription factor Y subunit B-8 [Pisum sativum]